MNKPICDEWKDIRKIFQENLVSYRKGYQNESPEESTVPIHYAGMFTLAYFEFEIPELVMKSKRKSKWSQLNLRTHKTSN